jgi:hypothetical protein
MKPVSKFLLLALVCLMGTALNAQKVSLSTYLVHKWRIIWYADNGDRKNMEAKKQQLHLRADGTGTMYMLGEVVGPVTWSVAAKKKILFSDDPIAPAYLVTVKTDKTGKTMLFTGTMSNGVKRQVFFEVLSGKP